MHRGRRRKPWTVAIATRRGVGYRPPRAGRPRGEDAAARTDRRPALSGLESRFPGDHRRIPMKRPRIRLRWLVPLAFLLLPPMFWALLLSVVPTDWARQRLVNRMSAA